MVDVTARKLGTWNEETGVFDGAVWLPAPGATVQLFDESADAFDPDVIGHVPGTEYGVRIELNSAVTQNTAVLGVLGVGKSHLAWELIQRMLDDGIKVVALDITGEYSKHFAAVCSPETERGIVQRLNEEIAENLDNTTVRGTQAGNIVEFEQAIESLLNGFTSGEERLLILNPSRFQVSRMEGKPFSGRANYMPRLTMAQVTQVITETILSLMDSTFSERARLCVVFEEAHSLIPEWNSAVNEGDSTAANGTARAILQGRKYGLGCLVVTQRTANVTKSILNQCNTIFALRTYDTTGMGFLENYIGQTHAQLLATLPERHAVVFGSASSCNAPIILRLNDAAALESGFWAPRVAAIPTTSGPVSPGGLSADGSEQPGEGDDDIPF